MLWVNVAFTRAGSASKNTHFLIIAKNNPSLMFPYPRSSPASRTSLSSPQWVIQSIPSTASSPPNPIVDSLSYLIPAKPSSSATSPAPSSPLHSTLLSHPLAISPPQQKPTSRTSRSQT